MTKKKLRNMGDIKTYSPFFKVKKTLKFLRAILGFPLKPTDESLTEFSFITWLEIFRYSILNIFPVILHGYVFVVMMLSLDGDFGKRWKIYAEYYKGVYNHYSTSKIDIVVVAIWTLVIFIGMTIKIIFFHRNVGKINDFCNEFCMAKSRIDCLPKEHLSKQPDGWSDKIECSQLLLILGQCLNYIATVLFGIWFYVVTMHISEEKIRDHHIREKYPLLDGMYAFWYVTIYMLQVSFTLFGPLACGVELMICQIINEVAGLFDDWQKILRFTLRMCPYEVDDNNGIDEKAPKKNKSRRKRLVHSFLSILRFILITTPN